jgi:NHL repeat
VRFTARASIAALAVAAAGLVAPAGAAAEFGPLDQFGSLGTGSGQVDSPVDIASDGLGKLFVADRDNFRVDVFSTGGTFLYAFGLDVDEPDGGTTAEVCTTACRQGNSGGAAGALDSPVGIAVDGAGNVFVAEESNHRISVFTSAGTFVKAFGRDVAEPDGGTGPEVCPTDGACRSGDSGIGSGALNLPAGLDVDGSTLFVADSNNYRIDLYGTDGTFQKAFGADVNEPDGATVLETCTTTCRLGNSSGGGAGQLDLPLDVVADGAGNVYVANTSNLRVDSFSVGGSSAVFNWGAGFDSDPAGGTGFEICTTSCQDGDFGFAAGQVEPYGMAMGADGNVQVADFDANRVSVFDSTGNFVHAFGAGVETGGTGFEFCTLVSTCQAGSTGTGAGELNLPYGITTDGGDTYVGENGNNRISKFGQLPPPATTPPPTVATTTAVTVTGLRAAALKKCKKKKTAAKRRKCKRRARRLPL